MSEAMTDTEFRRGMLRLAETKIDGMHARRIVAKYVDADEKTRKDCSDMLRADLAELDADTEGHKRDD